MRRNLIRIRMNIIDYPRMLISLLTHTRAVCEYNIINYIVLQVNDAGSDR